MIFSGDCYEFSGAENAFEEDNHVFVGVPLMLMVIRHTKVYLRTKNEQKTD